ncbi:molybdate transport system substrate-binding protein [Pedobacter cryoconitis]|uniref:Molybdate transport system substrate-binding protein n=1 Tax=Pedobacter cryoconitis TaxID=188932 RepID=A0A7W9E0H0_9SPHI|nr:molybdate ABC transporter substrate-binding protein [Pedobacter cryoconitis]MBB5637988.1 molybdate transport system substrate-binding protein [Pedobacter cryoconitis]MBB6270932.1 molybdate transport system substrate-binding protein [Pedobacter cryoconitis]
MNYKSLATISHNQFIFKFSYPIKKIVLLILAVWAVLPAIAQPVRVAVAANAHFVLRKLADDFKKKTGVEVEIISGSSGKLTAQIKNGAPYDVFLSADMDFAQSVYTDGFALSKPRVYALGSLIVCSTTGAAVENWKTLIRDQKTGKIAIGNPTLAPYGKAAAQALNYYGLYHELSSRLVFGESISQVNTYVLKKVVNIGFTTESLVYELSPADQFKWQKIDVKAYAPIQQGAVLLKYAKNKNFVNNKRFYDYLFSAGAKAIFGQFGYRTL